MADDDAKQHFTFTVYTGTRNRAHTLNRPYDSLRSQTFRDFEWLVVDNESTDGTPELIARWQAEADFPIRYIRHANEGHHGSSNVAVQEARGEFFLTLDSDDAAIPEALERFLAIWNDIPADRRDRYSAVTGLAVDENGDPTGDRFPTDILDSNTTEMRYRYKVIGEKWGFQRTDVMRAHPFPTVPGYTGMISSHIDLGSDRPGVPDALRQRVPRHRLLRPAGHADQGRQRSAPRRARRAHGGRCHHRRPSQVLPVRPGRLLPEGGQVLA